MGHHHDAFICTGVRTPIGKFGGGLAGVRADDLAAHVISELMKRCPGLDPAVVDDVILGCANQAGEDNRNVARMAALLSGLPVSVPGETVNRLCASGMAAINQARRAIQAGDAHLCIAGGVEQMTRSHWVISKTSTAWGRDAQMYDSSFGWRFINPRMASLYGTHAMGETAENLSEGYKISREDQDQFAVWSQQKAAAAQSGGVFANEIVPVVQTQKKGGDIVFAQDEFIKPGTSIEALCALKPAFKEGGSVTAGNSSGLNDGACAVIVACEKAAIKQGLKLIARIVSAGISGVEPRIMGIGPVTATQMALERAKLTMEDIGCMEINEAFAAQVLACTRALGLKDDDPRINPHGGAIALGHPLGMSGARITYHLALTMQAQNKQYGLATMCIGVGQGYALILEKV